MISINLYSTSKEKYQVGSWMYKSGIQGGFSGQDINWGPDIQMVLIADQTRLFLPSKLFQLLHFHAGSDIGLAFAVALCCDDCALCLTSLRF